LVFPESFIARTNHCSIQYGELAQLGERLVCNQEVTGSSPVFSISVRLWAPRYTLLGPRTFRRGERRKRGIGAPRVSEPGFGEVTDTSGRRSGARGPASEARRWRGGRQAGAL
jgi:hypothetical protein